MVRRLRHVVNATTIIVANDADLVAQLQVEPQPHFVPDRYPDTGTLGGIATGLHALPQAGWALIMACDLPLVNARLCQALIAFTAERDVEGQDRWDVVMPVVEDFAEPLHALYHARALPAIEARLARGERRAISFHPDVRVRYVDEATLRRHDPALHSFMNANTPDEWATALALLAAEQPQ
jgi:molybdopterin-guanine dinucleotide biosynthesis protein A